MDTKPFIEGDTIVNATRGKSAVLTCVVHNVKNYKVSFLNSFKFILNHNKGYPINYPSHIHSIT